MLEIPIPYNEMDRLLNLAEFDLDYTNHQDNFKDLARLAAKVAGTDVSLVNMIDTFTQWTISHHGLDIDQMPRDESVANTPLQATGNLKLQTLARTTALMINFT